MNALAKLSGATAQVRVKKRFIVDGHSAGTIFWTTPHRARIFLDQGAVELVEGNVAGPTVTPTAGPQEAKRSSSGDPTGRSTASVVSDPSGLDESSSASGEVRRSTLTNATLFVDAASATAAESSQSTMRTRSRRSRT